MIRLTLDTNVVRDLLEPAREGHRAAHELTRLDKEGLCELRLVSRVNADIPEDPLRARAASLEIWSRPIIPTIGQWDLSRWDEDCWASEDDGKLLDTLVDVIFPGAKSNESKQRGRLIDVGHLVGHRRAGRDAFVTNEKAFLVQAARLEAEFGIRVLSSSGAVAHVKHHHGRENRASVMMLPSWER